MPTKKKSSKYDITVKTDLSFDELLDLSVNPIATKRLKDMDVEVKNGKAVLKEKKPKEAKPSPKKETAVKAKKSR